MKSQQKKINPVSNVVVTPICLATSLINIKRGKAVSPLLIFFKPGKSPENSHPPLPARALSEVEGARGSAGVDEAESRGEIEQSVNGRSDIWLQGGGGTCGGAAGQVAEPVPLRKRGSKRAATWKEGGGLPRAGGDARRR